MKRVIDGVSYNTETATLLSRVGRGGDEVRLYETSTGEFFTVEEETLSVWNPRSETYEDREQTTLTPQSPEQAMRWLRKPIPEKFRGKLKERWLKKRRLRLQEPIPEKLRGKLKQQWVKLTDDDLDVIERRSQLESKIQERYGYGKDQVRREVDAFWVSQPLQRRVPPGSTTVYVRMPRSLKERIEAAAAKANTSVNVWALRAFERMCSEQEQDEKPASEEKAAAKERRLK
jgi:uncharacterized protein YjbJ (UPF0337 family)